MRPSAYGNRRSGVCEGDLISKRRKISEDEAERYIDENWIGEETEVLSWEDATNQDYASIPI